MKEVLKKEKKKKGEKVPSVLQTVGDLKSWKNST